MCLATQHALELPDLINCATCTRLAAVAHVDLLIKPVPGVTPGYVVPRNLVRTHVCQVRHLPLQLDLRPSLGLKQPRKKAGPAKSRLPPCFVSQPAGSCAQSGGLTASCSWRPIVAPPSPAVGCAACRTGARAPPTKRRSGAWRLARALPPRAALANARSGGASLSPQTLHRSVFRVFVSNFNLSLVILRSNRSDGRATELGDHHPCCGRGCRGCCCRG